MCAHPLVIVHFDSFESKIMNNLPRLPRIFIGHWAAACYSYDWFYPAPGYELRLSRVLPAEYKLRPSRVPAVGYKLRLTLSYSWLEFRRLDTGYGRLRQMADLSSDIWIRVTADFILRPIRVPAAGTDLRLIPSCGWLQKYCWFYSVADSSLPAGLDLLLTYYTLIYQINLRTYSANNTFFMVCCLPPDFSYHWSRLWLLLQEPWRSLRKLEEASRSFKTLAATDSSCSSWFELRRLIQDLRPINYL